MGQLERDIVAALQRFLSAGATNENCMYVFPTRTDSQYPELEHLPETDLRIDGPVLMVCRPDRTCAHEP